MKILCVDTGEKLQFRGYSVILNPNEISPELDIFKSRLSPDSSEEFLLNNISLSLNLEIVLSIYLETIYHLLYPHLPLTMPPKESVSKRSVMFMIWSNSPEAKTETFTSFNVSKQREIEGYCTVRDLTLPWDNPTLPSSTLIREMTTLLTRKHRRSKKTVLSKRARIVA